MYQADRDRVVDLRIIPQPDAGAPLPSVVCSEHRLLLAYIVSERDPNWDGSYATMVSRTSEDKPIAIVEFVRVRAHSFGPPNDEAFAGHPLASRGLEPYSISEIEESSWLRGLERMNAVHPSHSPSMLAKYKHYIFAFHDSTFECIAEGFTFELLRGSMRTALVRMTTMLDGDAP